MMSQNAELVRRSTLEADRMRVCGGSVKMRLDWLDRDDEFLIALVNV